MLRMRDTQPTVHYSTLYLRRHNQGLSISDEDNLVEITRAVKPGKWNGTNLWNLMTRLFAVVCFLIFMIKEPRCPSMASLTAAEERFISFLRTEAGLLDEDENEEVSLQAGCDYSKGRWVRSNRGPSYSGKECTRWLALMWACRLSNRTDFEYENFRWQPDACDLPVLSPRKFLQRMRSKSIAFIGDSLGRQQFQSLMCLLTGGRDNEMVKDVGAEYGLSAESKTVRPAGWAYRFEATNTTILFYWSSTLTDLEALNQSDPSSEVAMHIDRPPGFLAANLHRFDVVILNTGPHWNPAKFAKNRWKMHVQGKALSSDESEFAQDINRAYNFTVHRVVGWLQEQLERGARARVFYRTQSPRHFFHGDWDSGGRCDNTRLSSAGTMVIKKGALRDGVAENAVMGMSNITLLNITLMSQMRDEAHISKYTLKANNKHGSQQDCLHWCLPGVPDTWNHLFSALL